ncbi:hypothetical protein BHK69_02840 [Bosea vaviloviae]|uniref:Transposase IS4-like domain-containing protein n=1 Tax=Bosea vaviloviae TaxID=1526658 RepID=A0A1D7TWS1_9HYPH|nr:hypothetical protein BHK69_02840 [Bosea vaviloviae]
MRSQVPCSAKRRLSTARASRALKKGAGIDPPGFGGGKKIKGKKRHVLVDTQGVLIDAIVHAADIQDPGGGVRLMATMFGLYPFLLKLYADAGYRGRSFNRAWPRSAATQCRDRAAARPGQLRGAAHS